MNQLSDILDQDLDPVETREWTDALAGVINADGTERAHYLLERMVDETRRAGGYLPFAPTTEYVNTIPPHLEARSPGDATMEWKIRSLIRWNAMAMVVRANRKPGDLGGHIASFASQRDAVRRRLQPFLARAAAPSIRATCCSIQGHSSPGHLRARLPRRPHQRGPARPLPHGSRRQGPRPQLLSASVADAGLLADADRVDGPGPDAARSTRRASGSTWKAAA